MNGKAASGGVPAWYWAVAIGALLFEAFGCYAYLADVGRSQESLPLDQRALADATPWWIMAAYATAVWSGLLGAILLLFRRRHAAPLLLLSLAAVIVQFGGVFLVRELRQAAVPDAFTLPIVIGVVAFGLWRFARTAARRGWLR